MPGIVGILGAGNRETNGQLLHRMLGCMMHEPWYASGTYINEELGVWVGWVGHHQAYADCLPVWNESRDLGLVFAGEDHSAPGHDRAAVRNGKRYEQCNARYLISLYEDDPAGFLERLNGWFCGLLIDLRRQEAVLFNDRYGLGRLNCHETADQTYFASEAKALLAVLPDTRRIDPAALGEVFACGCALGDKTLFQGISLVPAGSAWSYRRDGSLGKTRYFDRRQWEEQEPLEDRQFYQHLRELFPRILQRYTRRANQKLAMSLTGGLDGRMIMAWANAPASTLPCYTFGGMYRDCSDVRIARRIAAACGQSHETIAIGRDFLDLFPRLAEKSVYVSDGTMDVTGAVELYANRLAREIAPLRLTGNYGSEIVRGNVAFRPGSVNPDFLDPGFAPLVAAAKQHYAAERDVHRVSFIAFKQTPWHHYARLSVEQSQIGVRSPFLDNDLVQLMYRAAPATLVAKEPSLRLIAEGNPLLGRIPTDRGLRYQEVPVLSRIHHEFQEFTAKAEYAYDYGMPQWLARIDHALHHLHLERIFLGRHKFYHFRLWYRDRLADYVREVLLDERTLGRPHFNPAYLRAMVAAHTSGRRNHTLEIHRALTTELIHRELLEHPRICGGSD